MSDDAEPPVGERILSVHLDLDLDSGELRIHAPSDPLRSCGLMELAKFNLMMQQHGQSEPPLVEAVPSIVDAIARKAGMRL